MVENDVKASDVQDSYDNFAIEMSRAAGVDITPCIKFWAMPLTGKVQEAMDEMGLQPYFFENYITETVAPGRRDEILQEYPGVNREVSMFRC